MTDYPFLQEEEEGEPLNYFLVFNWCHFQFTTSTSSALFIRAMQISRHFLTKRHFAWPPVSTPESRNIS